MADNVTGTDFSASSVTLATDDIGGVQYPRTKIAIGNDGVNDGDISQTNPMPIDSQKLDEINVRLADIADSVGNLSPDVVGRLRVNVETGGTLTGVTTVSTVSTVSTVGNQTNMGGYSAAMLPFNFSQMSEMALRQNIVIS